MDAAFAAALMDTGLVNDPWYDGSPRFSATPVIIPVADAHALADAATRVTLAYDELVRFVAADPDCARDFFQLSEIQDLMFRLSAPRWHAYARADVFRCKGGRLQICELNSDTPSGFSDAVALGRTADGRQGADPNAGLADAFVSLVKDGCARRFPGQTPCVGIVYPTELTEDLGLISWWRRSFEAQGWPVALGSPYNLHASTNGRHLCLLGQRCNVIVRHYKTDWWGERRTIWTDEAPYPDADALDGPLGLLLAADTERRALVINPFGAVVPQNKRSMALFWRRIDQWTARTAATVRALIPYTAALDEVDIGELRRTRPDWVLKSAYGCEGDEVLVGALMSQHEWSRALVHARPQHFIVQQRFNPVLDDHGRETNHGVFVVGGEPAGLYSRISTGPTDATALSVATLVNEAGLSL